MLTPNQQDWAAQHDWFVAYAGDTIVVADRYVENGEFHESCLTWQGTFQELRHWAGY